jgi:dihydrofolate synthase/folylpolyglutamate synthase
MGNLPEFLPEAYLDSLGRFGVQLGLERMASLLTVLEEPQRGIPVIHVAGTNGKGSVCALLSHVLMAAGLRVGRYTSPHLVDWRERIWVRGEWISAADWQRVLQEVREALTHYPPEVEPPTQFEVVTAAAWLYFRQQAVDCAVLEVGLGGRLDATNVGIDSCLSLVTSIGWDHWQRLGNSLAAIAFEKAGILRPHVPAISGPQVPEVLTVLQQQAIERKTPLQVVAAASWEAPDRIEWHGRSYRLGLQGDAQLENGAIALAAIEKLRQVGWQIPEAAVQQGLATVQWPGRLQWSAIGGRKVLLDGAHNQPAAGCLRRFIDTQFPGQTVTWMVGILSTKDVAGILQTLLRPGDRLYALPIRDRLACEPSELVKQARRVQPHLALLESLHSLDALESTIRMLPATAEPIVICGSLYLLGQLMQHHSFSHSN